MSTSMQIDCGACPVRDVHCDDCMVTALLDIAAPELPLDSREQQAVELLLSSGLITHEVALSASARHEPLRQLRVTG